MGLTGERFEGLLPPVVEAPAFAIRKPAVAVFTLDDYAATGIMTSGQASALKVAVEARKNILVAGGTSSGKTTLTNALLAEVAKTSYLWRQWRNGHNRLGSFAASASRSSPRRSLPVHRRDSGACQDTRRFNTPYEIRCSTLLVSPESSCLYRLNSIEPPWYGLVRPVVWEGGVARRPLSRSVHDTGSCCPHSITSSARASSMGGIVRLSVLAVLRLITSSNLVGCWMGRSAGFAPFRMAST
jgi:hypothetical protein